MFDITSHQYLGENLGAAKIHLSPEEVKEVRAEAEQAGAAQGSRYPPGMDSLMFPDTPELPVQ